MPAYQDEAYFNARVMRWEPETIVQLPQGIGFEWTGQSREEKLSGSQAGILLAFSMLVRSASMRSTTFAGVSSTGVTISSPRSFASSSSRR